MVLAVAAMVLLPLIEVVLRKLFHTGIATSDSLVQYLCLVLGMRAAASPRAKGGCCRSAPSRLC